MIAQAVSWYLRYPLSYRDIEELLLERGLEVDHSTVNRWVLAYAPLIERRLRPFRKPHCGSVRVDETYVRIRGEWRYLYRAIDKHGEAVDVLLTARRDLDAAKRFFRKMLKDGPLLSPDRIGTDGAPTYPGAIVAARKEGRMARDPVHHVTKHLQQGIESDHFRLKKNMPRVGGFQNFNTARRSIQGFEAVLWLRKGFGFAGAWTVHEQTGCSGCASGFRRLTKRKTGVVQARSATYSDLAILTALTLRTVFRRVLRQTEGLIGSVMGLLGLDLAVPDHSTLSRLAATVEVPRPRASPEAGPFQLLVDSTGLKLCGAGE